MSKTHNESVSDAMVDTYRALREINAKAAATPIASKPITPGAGVDPAKVIKPGKRIRNWHRSARPGETLKSFARALAKGQPPNATDERVRVARRWLASKGIKL